jgi:hypothetical protein
MGFGETAAPSSGTNVTNWGATLEREAPDTRGPADGVCGGGGHHGGVYLSGLSLPPT